jgi:Holliday junction DNA helicase RuvA
MISFLDGIVQSVFEDCAILNVNGVGYKIYLHEEVLFKMNHGDKFSFYIYQSISDHGISLFGFVDEDQLIFFEKLISVSGVGPKLAMGILESPIDIIKQAIVNRDVTLLVEFPGIGKKTAERLCVELQSKILNMKNPKVNLVDQKESKSTTSNSNHQTPLCNEEAFAALQSLGFTRLEAHRLISVVPSTIFDTEEIVKLALKAKK